MENLFIHILNSFIAACVMLSCIHVYKDEYIFSHKLKWSSVAITCIITVIFSHFQTSTSQVAMTIESIIVALLIYLSITDIMKMEIPDGINLTILIIGVFYLVFIPSASLGKGLLTGLILFIIFFIIGLIPGAMGGGDIKYVGAIGLFFTPPFIVPFIYLAFLASFAYTIIIIIVLLILRRKIEPHFPFGPFLVLSSVGILFFT